MNTKTKNKPLSKELGKLDIKKLQMLKQRKASMFQQMDMKTGIEGIFTSGTDLL